MTPSLAHRLALPLAAGLALATAPLATAQHSVARQWNEKLLESIRRDFARPTVHARNLFHVAIAMWDGWATYDQTAQPFLFTEDHGTTDPYVDDYRNEAISHAVYAVLRQRFGASPGAAVMLPQYDALMVALGYNAGNTSTVGTTPAAIGNRLGQAIIAFGLADNSNEQNTYANRVYAPINAPLVPALPGNPNLTNPNRWQPLALSFFIDQNGQVILGGYPPALSPEWGQVSPFALSQRELTTHRRGNYDWWVYHDPGEPPYYGTARTDEFKWTFELVSAWSSHLDPADGVMIDASPGGIGNATIPATPAQYPSFYDFAGGGDSGPGYLLNPVTGQPYAPQIVPRGDYSRCLAEFWADGPTSETPPGHWFTILNYVSDQPGFQKRIRGAGPLCNALEWDCKSYVVLGGAMHDVAITAWGIKGWYDYIRPVSAIRYLARIGQCSDASAPNYRADGITLHPGLIENVTAATTAPGQRHAHLAGSEGKVAVKAWRGPPYITNPATDVAGVGWILAENWWPYQRPTFVTPPFPGYISGHSTYSRAAATVMHTLTGSRWFPNGLGEFTCPQDAYLVFERGPSVTVKLQWASYYDASDQCSLSRIWGGIHPPADDIPGRWIGTDVADDAFALAEQLWAGTAPPKAAFTAFGAGCAGSNGTVEINARPSGMPVVGSTMTVDIENLPVLAPQTHLAVGFASFVPGLDLTVVGMPTCTLDVNPVVTLPVPASGGFATWSLSIPPDPVFNGVTMYLQALTPDAGVNPLGLTTSIAGDALMGR